MSRTARVTTGTARERLGVGIAGLTLALAVAAALLTGSGGLTSGVESLSFASGSFLREIARGLPVRYYAFGAGMLAAVNPCGFALLPVYFALYLGDPGRGRGWALLRALWASGAVTLGFVLLFGATGLVLGALTAELSRLFPLVGLVVGALLVVAGGRMIAGGGLYSGLAARFADRVGASARRIGAGGYLLYGVAYGAASLGCTLPIFLTVVGSATTTGSLRSGALQFLLYALGMGAVLSALTLSAAVVRNAVIANVRMAARFVEPVSAVLLLVAGAYVVYYWLTLGGVLASLR